MDFRIGAKSPVYGTRQTAKVTDKELKQSFAMKMAEVKPPRQDIVEISVNPLAQRLENVHQQINEMDFTGKTSEEVYKSIIDAYEGEFGFSDLLFYTDRESDNIVDEDMQRIIENTVPNYQNVKKGLYYRAMGYDKMSNAEKIEAIRERVGGNSYVHKICELNEMCRAGIITTSQQFDISGAMERMAGMEYCAKMGFDYITWSSCPEKYHGEFSENRIPTWPQDFMAWAAKTEVTWLEVIESIQENPALRGEEKNELIKELEETSELLKRSDNAC